MPPLHHRSPRPGDPSSICPTCLQGAGVPDLWSQETPANVVELLRPGSFVRLRNQPDDLPPFQLILCRGGRCWVRQQAWGRDVHWEVEHRQLTAVA